ncbi:MAG: hypothetical protein ACHQT8_07175, partial [Chlamydiales bacterium]
LAFLVGPVLTARLFTHRLPPLIFLAAGFGSLAALIGVALSRHLFSVYALALSTSGLVVAVIGIFYFASVLFAPRQGLLILAAKKILWKRELASDHQGLSTNS